MLDVAVIGAGPAGCAAAVQCSRLGLDTILVDSTGRAGGLIREARLIENYPGLEEPVSGLVFTEKLLSILSRSGIAVKDFHVDSISLSNGTFRVSDRLESIESRSVIIAVGTVPKEFVIDTKGDAVIHRSILELMRNTPRRSLIVGGGEAALDYALNLSDSGSSVRILVRSPHLKASGSLRDRALAHSRIEILYNTVPAAVTGVEDCIRLEAHKAGSAVDLEADALLVAIGREPRLPEMMDEFIHDRGNVGTSIQGLFVVGDASLGSLGQAGIAVGQGILAAASASEFLREESGQS